MSLILDGTSGLSDVDGTAATPAIRGTDTNTGIFFPAADTIAFAEGGTEAMRIDSAGNVGIGTTTTVGRLRTTLAADGLISLFNGTTYGLTLTSSSSESGAKIEATDPTGTASYQPLILNGSIQQLKTGGTERMRIDSSGNLWSNATAFSSSMQSGISLQAGGNNQIWVSHENGTGGGQNYSVFFYNGGIIGSISQNGTTGVLYNLTSDYRLKENATPLTGASKFIMSLKPKSWDWWDGSGKGVGFIAHEFMEVAKHSGSGEKDAVDAEGKPVYQAIQPSSSEVMANLVSLVQELNAKVDAQALEIAELKAKP